MRKQVRLSKSSLSPAEKEAVMRVLDGEYLGMGSDVNAFETSLTEFFGRPVVCVVNGTAALHLALQAIGVGPGDEVLVQSLTYVASFQAISATGAKPVACDVHPDSLCLDFKDAERRLTPRTKAIMPVHYSGGVGDVKGIYAFAKKHDLRVVEDAAHAFGSFFEGQKIGSFGDIACFSFDGIKNITSGEGGCIVTDDEATLNRIRDSRLLGVVKDTDNRYLGKRSWQFDVTAQGWRYHMSNLMAVIGSVQLSRFSEMSVKRQQLATHYQNVLKDSASIKTIEMDYREVVPHIFVVLLDETIDRELARTKLLEEKIETGVHYYPNHRHSFFEDKSEFPVTDSIEKRIMTLPLHPDLTLGDVNYVVKNLVRVVSEVRNSFV